MRTSNGAMSMILPGRKFLVRATVLLAAAVSMGALSGCAKTVNIKREGPYLGVGAYRSLVAAPEGNRNYQLELKRDGRFTLKAFASGCMLQEQSGNWSSSEEYLDFEVKEAHRRDACAEPLLSAGRQEHFSCPIRKLSDKAFQMIHEEIIQGTQWTEWNMNTSGMAFADPAAADPTERNLSAAR